MSGAKGRDKRPAFDRLLKAVTRRKMWLPLGRSIGSAVRSYILVGCPREIIYLAATQPLCRGGLSSFARPSAPRYSIVRFCPWT